MLRRGGSNPSSRMTFTEGMEMIDITDYKKALEFSLGLRNHLIYHKAAPKDIPILVDNNDSVVVGLAYGAGVGFSVRKDYKGKYGLHYQTTPEVRDVIVQFVEKYAMDVFIEGLLK